MADSSKGGTAAKETASANDRNIDAIREVAKWLIGAFAAVATALIAGTQLSGIGKLPIDGTRFWVAVVSVIGAVAAVAWAIWILTDVLLPEDTTVADAKRMADDPKNGLGVAITTDKEVLLHGFGSIDELNAAYQDALDARTLAQSNVDRDSSDQAALEQLEQSARTASRLRPVLRNLTGLAAYYRQKQEFGEKRVDLFLAGTLTAIALIGFAWAANPKDDQGGDEHTGSAAAPAVAAPAHVHITLTPDGTKNLLALLGKECASQAGSGGVDAWALAATGAEVELLLIPSGVCQRPVHFTLPLAQGVAAPLAPVVPPTPSPSPS